MPTSYRAVLEERRVHWLDEVPEALRDAEGKVHVHVTVVGERGGGEQEELSTLLDELAAADPFRDVEDPGEWQRRLRRGTRSS
jgi:hypothetical protein